MTAHIMFEMILFAVFCAVMCGCFIVYQDHLDPLPIGEVQAGMETLR